MKGSITLFLFLSSILNTYCQTTKIDSLLLSAFAQKNDTIKMITFQEIIKYYSVNDLVKANQYCDSLLILASNTNYSKAEINHYVLKGILEFRKSDFRNAILVWKKGLSHPNIQEYSGPRVSMVSNIAVGHKALQETDSFVKYSEIGLKLNLENNNTVGLLANYFTLADHYSSNKDVNLASDYTNKLMELAIIENDYSALARSHVMFGKLNRIEYQFENAIIEFQKAVDIYQNEFPENEVMLRSLRYEVANTHLIKKDFSKASEILEEILLQEEENNISQNFLSTVKMSLLRCYNNIGDKFNADIYYGELKNGLIIKNAQDSIKFFFAMAEFELQFNTYTPQTKKNIMKGLEISLKYDEIESKSILNKLLSVYYTKNGDYKNAHHYLSKSYVYKDSLRTVENARVNLSHQRKFEAINSENKILEQEKDILEKSKRIDEQESKTQQLWLFLLGIAAILSFIIGVYYLLRVRHLKQENEFQLAVAEKRKLEQELLKKNDEQAELLEMANESDFDDFLVKKFNLQSEELLLWKLISDGLNQKDQAETLNKSVDTIKTWKRKGLYPKLNDIQSISDGYNQHKSTQLYKDEIKRFYNMRYQNKLNKD